MEGYHLPVAHKDVLARTIWDRIRLELAGEPGSNPADTKPRKTAPRAKGKHA